MELRDLIVTPLLILVVYLVAYLVRPRVTDKINRKYFMPALTLRIFGALAVGFIYQFYYDGGDTFNYHTHGSRHLWNAFWESPEKAIKLLFYDGSDLTGVYDVASRIPFITEPSSYAVIKVSFLLDLLTFSAYSSTAVLFSVISFIGMWMFFLTFYEQFPNLHNRLAIAAFFIPSVFFWGSGLLKDTLTLSCVGIATYQTYRIFIRNRFTILNLMLLFIALYGLYTVKIYILLVFLPCSILWIFFFNLSKVNSIALRAILLPAVVGVAVTMGFYSIQAAAEDSPKYSLQKIGQTAQTTAYDIRYYTGRDAGSGYSLGQLDGTFESMIRLAPQAINVALFRPYLWEVKNPLMLLSALESFAILLSTFYILIFRLRLNTIKMLTNVNVLFLLVFSLVFSFAVGVATFNFGTLVRYKIPMLPTFATALVLLLHFSKSDKKVEALDAIE